ncbi:PIN domain-containing protein [Desulfosalsimonas sp.]
MPSTRKKYNLDFDDACQYQIALENGFKIVTMDTDFKRIKNVPVDFI